MEPLKSCMSIWCSRPSICKCPFCSVHFCKKHGTKSRYDAWSVAKFGGDPPFQYWPCDICDRRLKDYKEFGQLSDVEYEDVLLEAFSYCTQSELESGLGAVKRPKQRYNPSQKTSNKKPAANKTHTKKQSSGKFCSSCGKKIGTGQRVASNLGNRLIGGMFGSMLAGPIGAIIGARIVVKENAKHRTCYDCS